MRKVNFLLVREMFQAYQDGETKAAIARRLGLSKPTVNYHLQRYAAEYGKTLRAPLRGFASLSLKTLQEIGQRGGRAAQAAGKGRRFVRRSSDPAAVS